MGFWGRIDVTLRVSGLFRDVFPGLSAMFGQAVAVLSERDEASDWNPYAGTAPGARVYGPKPGSFGLGMEHLSEELTAEARLASFSGDAPWSTSTSCSRRADSSSTTGPGWNDSSGQT